MDIGDEDKSPYPPTPKILDDSFKGWILREGKEWDGMAETSNIYMQVIRRNWAILPICKVCHCLQKKAGQKRRENWLKCRVGNTAGTWFFTKRIFLPGIKDFPSAYTRLWSDGLIHKHFYCSLATCKPLWGVWLDDRACQHMVTDLGRDCNGKKIRKYVTFHESSWKAGAGCPLFLLYILHEPVLN